MPVQIANQRVVNVLKSLPLFVGSSADDLAGVAAFSVLRHMPRGQSLFSRNEPCTGLYHLVSGLAKLARYGARGGEQVMDIAGPGRMLGLTALFTRGGYPFDAVAVDDCEVLVVQAGPLLAFVDQRPERLLGLGVELARRHERMVTRVEQLIGRTALQRVVLYLLESTAAVGEDGLIPPPLIGVTRRADVANMLGLTPETFSRVMARLRRSGLIRDKGGVVDVVNREQLLEVLEAPDLVREREQAATA